jgi:hypothetical protein
LSDNSNLFEGIKMYVVRAHTPSVELNLDQPNDQFAAQLGNLAALTEQFIEASGARDALSFAYQPSSSDPSSTAVNIQLYRTTLPQYIRIRRDSGSIEGASAWTIEAQAASKPTNVREGAPRELRLGVLAIVDSIQYRLSNGQATVAKLERLLEYAPKAVSLDAAKSVYSSCFQPEFAVRSITQGITRMKKRGDRMTWSSHEWSIE